MHIEGQSEREDGEMDTSVLRPVFFRFGHIPKAMFSGWVHYHGNNIASSLDVWALESDLRVIAQEVSGFDPSLARYLSILQGDETSLSLVPNARPCLMPGERVEFVKDVDLFPTTFIEKGERGVVVRRDRTTGDVELFLERSHKLLKDSSNTITLTPHISDDVVRFLSKFMDDFTAVVPICPKDFAAA